MAVISVRVPDDLKKVVKSNAAFLGKSMQDFVIEALKTKIVKGSKMKKDAHPNPDDFDNDTDYLMASEANRERLEAAMKNIENGLAKEHDLIEV